MLGRRMMFGFLWVFLCAVGAVFIGTTATAAAAACVGDCDGSGEVTVDELVTMVNIDLVNAPLSGCTAGDADNSGDITIDEIIAAVNNALTSCPALPPTSTPTDTPIPTDTPTLTANPTPTQTVTSNDQVEMSTRGLLCSMHGIDATDQLHNAIIDFGCVHANGCAGAHPQLAARSALLPQVAQGACPGGGTVTTTCTADEVSITFMVSYTNCHSVDPASGDPFTVNGSLMQTFGAPGVCSTGQVPDGTSFVVNAIGFSKTVTDQQNHQIAQVTANMTQMFTATDSGCFGPNGTSIYNGMLSILDAVAGTNATYNYRDLSLAVQSAGVPCTSQTTATGSLDVDDRVSGDRFSMILPKVIITEGVGTLADGDMQIDCIGGVVADTLQEIGSPFAHCDGEVVGSYAALPPNLAGPDGFTVGSVVRASIKLGTGSLPGATQLRISNVFFDLDCSAASPPGVCNDDGDVVSFQGNIVNVGGNCVDGLVGGEPVTFASNIPVGGSVPNHLVLTPSAPIVIAASSPTSAANACELQFDLRLDASRSNDSTPLSIEQRAGLGSAMCDNGGFSFATGNFALTPFGSTSCEPQFILSHPPDVPLAVPSEVTIQLRLGTGTINGGTKMTVNDISFDLDCNAASPPGGCNDDGDLVSFQDTILNVGGNCLDDIIGGNPVTFTANVPVGGSVPNRLVLTPSAPIVVAASSPTSAANACTVTFVARVDHLSNSTPFTILQQAGFLGVCDNGLSGPVRDSGTITINPTPAPGAPSSPSLVRGPLRVGSVARMGGSISRRISSSTRALQAVADQSADCPLGGLVALRPPGAGASNVKFMVDGSVQLDFNGDGIPDKVINSCKDLLVVRCSP